MITIVPTSHIAKESLVKVKAALENADCVCVELDRLRYEGLKLGEKASIGFVGFDSIILWLFKKLQEWLGSKTGILPGTEMLEAVETGKERGLTVYLIDQDIRITVERIRKMPGKEKLKLFTYLISAPILMKFGRGEKIDLNKVPESELIKVAMEEFQKQFPYLYKVLVEERNQYMAQAIQKIKNKHEKIVVVVGAGHEEGLKQILSASS